MDRFDRADAVRNVELVKQFGPDRLDPSQVQSALQVAPQTVGKLLEQSGKNTPEFMALQRSAPADFPGDPDELRKKAGDKRDEAARADLESEAMIAKGASEAGKTLANAVTDAMRQVVESAVRDILNQIRGAKNTR